MPRRDSKYWQVSFEAPRLEEERQRRRPTGPACPGPCNARHRKAQEALDAYAEAVRLWEKYPIGNPPAEPEVPTVSPWPGEPVYCGRCQALIRRELAELDDLAAIRLAGADGHRRGPGAERVAGSRGTPSPSPSVDDIDELASMLRGWESVARGQDDTPPRRGFLAREITTVICWLIAHLDEILAREEIAADFATEVRIWHKRLCASEKAGTGRHHLPVPCRRCGQKSLEAAEGEEYVECVNMNFGDHGGRCGLLLSRDEYDLEAQAWLARRGQPAHPPAA
jgi:hypothetical protein